MNIILNKGNKINMCFSAPWKVDEVRENTVIATFKGRRREIIAGPLIERIRRGDYILCHAGYVVTKIPQSEAEETLELLDEVFDTLRP